MEALALGKAGPLLRQIVGYERALRYSTPPLFADSSRTLYLEAHGRERTGQEELHTMEPIQMLRDYDN